MDQEENLSTKARILVLTGDDFLYSLNLAMSLKMAGFAVIIIKGSEISTEKIKNIDLVIIDHDFLQCTEICTWLSGQTNIPVILLASSPSAEAWNKAVEIGVDVCLDRYVSRYELMARIKALLRRCNHINGLQPIPGESAVVAEKIVLIVDQDLLRKMDSRRGQMSRSHFVTECVRGALRETPLPGPRPQPDSVSSDKAGKLGLESSATGVQDIRLCDR